MPTSGPATDLVAAARRLSAQGYLVATGGNLSVRLPGGAFAITPSNLDYWVMTPEDVCVLDLDARPVDAPRKPSIESGLHAAVYRARPDVHAIVHTHQVAASAMALIDKPIPALFDEQVRFLGRAVEVVPYAPSGTWLLTRQMTKALRRHANAYVLKNHGAICLGPDLARAESNVELLEKCAAAYLLALSTGARVHHIPLLVREIAFGRLRAEQRAAGARLTTGEER